MTSAYTKKEEDKLVEMYTNNPCLETVDRISVTLNKPRKSVISKLVKMGVYITRGYRTKTGETPVTKLQIVRSIEDALDIKLIDLDKAPKTTLKKLAEAVADQTNLLESTLDELQSLHELKAVQKEMLKKSKSDHPIAVLHEV